LEERWVKELVYVALVMGSRAMALSLAVGAFLFQPWFGIWRFKDCFDKHVSAIHDAKVAFAKTIP